ncbi:Protein kinase domain-containing protein [Mycena chlorophos]|uniref:Protein kinase domain-containing protein n=1 Tax=Mycena chlorophos TaxID=658473 RepID=A0A8H6VWG7_MYCCL|nr:Protein kinase domain-containing protein [Mycena chlorophos]
MPLDQDAAARQLEEILSKPPPVLALPLPAGETPLRLGYPTRFFYDKHIDKSFELRRIVQAGAPMLDQFNDLAGQHLDEFHTNAQHAPIPSSSLRTSLSDSPFKPEDSGVRGVARYLAECTNLTRRVSSRLSLFPKAPEWHQFLLLGRVAREGQADSVLAVDEIHALALPTSAEGKLQIREPQHVSPDLLLDLQKLYSRSDLVGTWVVMTPSAKAESLITALDRATIPSNRNAGTRSFPILPRSTRLVPPDSPDPVWSTILVPNEPPPSSGRKLRSAGAEAVFGGHSTCGYSPSAIDCLRLRRADAGISCPTRAYMSPIVCRLRLIVRNEGWARAVETDSSVIVFTCGTLERIAIRHRETQTLYLSDVINITQIRHPPYLRLQVGLYIAVLKDALSRLHESEVVSPELRRSTRKRRAQEDDALGNQSKRRKTAAGSSRTFERPQSAIKIAGGLDFMLLYLRYGMHDSPAPASFIRSAPCLVSSGDAEEKTRPSVKRKYLREECIVVILGPQIGTGATGIAHTASLEVVDVQGRMVTANIVVKIAFLAEQQQKMRHEFQVYRRLVAHKVKGVPEVYGIFDDLEGGAIILLMSHCGTTLWDLRVDPMSYDLDTKASQRTRFLAILDAIHAAGVRHHDLRPLNLLLDDRGQAHIIDFDVAKLDPTEGGKRRERRALVDLLFDGVYPDPSFPSLPSTVASDSGDGDE